MASDRQNAKKCTSLDLGDSVTTDPKVIADCFNAYYLNCVPTDISRSDSYRVPDHFPYLEPDGFCFSEITAFRVYELLRDLRHTSSLESQIPSKVLTYLAPLIADPLKDLVNLSVKTSRYPKRLKIYKVTPLHKSGNRLLCSNYRPVSVPPPLSRIFEKTMLSQISDYVDKNNILTDCQYGFRKGRSIGLALNSLIEQLRRAVDRGQIAIGVFMDLSKAFDAMDIEILLKKLGAYGFSRNAIGLLSDFLHHRIQFIKIADILSDPGLLDLGVPQGSLLGPLLFSLYINDIVGVCKILKLILFADDTSGYHLGETIHQTLLLLNEELQLLAEWYRENNLSINIKKTSFVHFLSPRGISTVESGSLCIDGIPLIKVSDIKFLGIWLDDRLSGSRHIDHLRGKLSSGVAGLVKCHGLLNLTSMKLVYHAFFTSRLVLGIEFFGICGKTKIRQLSVLQKRAVRIMLGLGFHDCVTIPMCDTGILPINYLTRYSICLFIFKILSGAFPNVVGLTCSTSVRLSAENLLVLNLSSSTTGHRALSITGASIWNELPVGIRSHTGTVDSFKYKIKKYYLMIAKQEHICSI
jgi:hypothetical protein